MVNRWLAVACVLALAWTVPVGAQDAATGGFILDDPAGDAPARSVYAPVDLVSLAIVETDEQLAFHVGMDDMEHREELGGVGRIDVQFVLGMIQVDYDSSNQETVTQYRDRYRLVLDHEAMGGQSTELQVFDVARGTWVASYTGCDMDCTLVTEVDEADESWIIHVPRDRLQTADAVTPNPSLPLHDFQVTATASYDDLSMQFTRVTDLMPNDGEPAGQFVPQLGVPPQVGHIRLSSDTPFRWSNGEATTYVFDVTLNKSTPAPDEITLSLSEVPENWDVKLPGESIYLEGVKRLQLPVVLTTPFSHEHGAFENFYVEARSANDPDAIGRVELGIRYAGIPQPTGHHARMWMHAAEPPPRQPTQPEHNVDGQPRTDAKFISALDPSQQPGSIDAWIYPDAQTAFDPADADFTWIFPLEPPLRTGFDFDMKREGEVQFEFQSAVELEDAVIFGGLYYRTPATVDRGVSPYDYTSDKLLASFYSSAKQDVPADQKTLFTATVRGMPDGDYIPYKPAGAYVFLSITLRHALHLEQRIDPEVFGPWMMPGATIDLPLNEYHDNVDELVVPLNDVSLKLNGPQRQYVNPGESVHYQLALNNSGVANERFNIRVRSLNSEWVSMLTESPIQVPSNGEAKVEFVVTAPADAWHGQISGPLIEVVSQQNPWSQASQRVYVEVDHDNDHPDMSHLLGDGRIQQDEQATPLAFLPGLLALGVAFVLRRRTRRI